jgi:hypothetical protein
LKKPTKSDRRIPEVKVSERKSVPDQGLVRPQDQAGEPKSPMKAWNDMSSDSKVVSKDDYSLVGEFIGDISGKSSRLVRVSSKDKFVPSPETKSVKYPSSVRTPTIPLFEAESATIPISPLPQPKKVNIAPASSPLAVQKATQLQPTSITKKSPSPEKGHYPPTVNATTDVCSESKPTGEPDDFGWNNLIRKEPPKNVEVRAVYTDEKLIVEDFD